MGKIPQLNELLGSIGKSVYHDIRFFPEDLKGISVDELLFISAKIRELTIELFEKN